MKIARISHKGLSEYSIIDGESIYPRSQLERVMGESLPETVAEFAENYLMNTDKRALLRSVMAKQKPGILLSEVSLLQPIDDRPKIICVGLNYRDHAEEQGAKVPEEPLIFMKPYTAIIGPNQPIIYPEITEKLDYEAELAVIIGKRCKKVTAEEAPRYILGYTCFNDVSARDIQYRDGQWFRGKSFDTFAPIGPWIVTGDEIGDPHKLRIMSRVNGEVRQNSNTANLIFDVYYLVSFISRVMTLEAGDIIATGTPAGVGIFYKPHPRLLKAGDLVEIEIEKIGVLANTVSRER